MPSLMNECPSLFPDIEIAGAVGHAKKKRGPKPKPVIEFPQALEGDWVDPSSFPEALALHMRRHGDSCNISIARLSARATRPIARRSRLGF